MKDSPTTQLSIRLPAPLLQGIEGHLSLLQSQHPGMLITRAAAIRHLIAEGLRHVSLALMAWDAPEVDREGMN